MRFVFSLSAAMLLASQPQAVVDAAAQSVADAPSDARAGDGRYISWREHIIDDEASSGIALRGGDGVCAADLDRDGSSDVVSVHEDSAHIRVAFGSRDPQKWLNRTLAERAMVRQVEDCSVGDVNDDGRPDIVAACERGHLIYFQAPADARDMDAWTPVILEATRGRGSWIRVKFADVDGDGKLDIIGANKGREEFSVFHRIGPASDPQAWREQVVGRGRTPINIHPVDMDGDGDLDLLAGSRGEEKVYVYENVDHGKNWKEHVVHAGEPTSTGFMLAWADLNGDGRTDVLTQAAGGGILWLEHPATLDGRWPVHEVGSVAPDYANALTLVDINGDGRLDVITGGYSADPRLKEPERISPNDSCGRLAWFEQPSDPTAAWTRHDISRRRRGMYDILAPVDVNRDGLIDFIGTRGNSGTYDGVFWLEQVRTPQPQAVFKQARAKDSPEVPLP